MPTPFHTSRRPAVASLLLLGCMLASFSLPVQARPFDDGAYLIRLGKTPIGASLVMWTRRDGVRHGDALTRIDRLLIQHQRLELDAAGLPTRYILRASTQGRESRIEVQREAGVIIEHVQQGGQTRTYRIPSPQPVDWLDNNAFDTLQALLYRWHGRLASGTVVPVFVPQARTFGRFAVEQAALRTAPMAGQGTRAVLHLQATLTVDGDTVPLQLDVMPGDSTLLRYRQTALGVTVTREASELPAP